MRLFHPRANKKLPGTKLRQFFRRHSFQRHATEADIDVWIRFILLVKRRQSRIQKMIYKFHAVSGLRQKVGNFPEGEKAYVGNIQQAFFRIGPPAAVKQSLH